MNSINMRIYCLHCTLQVESAYNNGLQLPATVM